MDTKEAQELVEQVSAEKQQEAAKSADTSKKKTTKKTTTKKTTGKKTKKGTTPKTKAQKKKAAMPKPCQIIDKWDEEDQETVKTRSERLDDLLTIRDRSNEDVVEDDIEAEEDSIEDVVSEDPMLDEDGYIKPKAGATVGKIKRRPHKKIPDDDPWIKIERVTYKDRLIARKSMENRCNVEFDIDHYPIKSNYRLLLRDDEKFYDENKFTDEPTVRKGTVKTQFFGLERSTNANITFKCYGCGVMRASSEYPYASHDTVPFFKDNKDHFRYPICIYCVAGWWHRELEMNEDMTEMELLEQYCQMTNTFWWPRLAEKILDKNTIKIFDKTGVSLPVSLANEPWLLYSRELRDVPQVRYASYVDSFKGERRRCQNKIKESYFLDNLFKFVNGECQDFDDDDVDYNEKVTDVILDVLAEKMPTLYVDADLEKYKAMPDYYMTKEQANELLRKAKEELVGRVKDAAGENINEVEKVQDVTIEDVPQEIQSNEKKSDRGLRNLSPEALAKRSEVIRVFHVDPFENEKPEARESMYDALVTMMDDAMADDLVKQKSAIEIVRGYNRIDNISNAISLFQADPKTMTQNEKSLKLLSEQKQKETATVLSLSKDNGFTERYASAKAKGSGTLSAITRDMASYHYDPGAVNAFDIKTAKAIQQVSDISAESIFKQLGLAESDYAKMVAEQAQLIKELKAALDENKEELRMYREKHLKAELMTELKKELIEKRIPRQDVKNIVDSEYALNTRGFVPREGEKIVEEKDSEEYEEGEDKL